MSQGPIYLIMFAKAPLPNQVKTRLIPSIGAINAAQLHAAFIQDMSEVSLRWAQHHAPARQIIRVIATSGDHQHEVFDALQAQDPGLLFWSQGDGDLGERLDRISRRAFDEGAALVLITGSDSPTLASAHYDEAVARLVDGAQVVFGPSFDGGYYLVGLSQPCRSVFEHILWSHESTLAMSLVAGRAAGCLLALTQFWYDVDTIDDLKFLSYHLQTYLDQDTLGSDCLYTKTRQLLSKLQALGALGESVNLIPREHAL